MRTLCGAVAQFRQMAIGNGLGEALSAPEFDEETNVKGRRQPINWWLTPMAGPFGWTRGPILSEEVACDLKQRGAPHLCRQISGHNKPTTATRTALAAIPICRFCECRRRERDTPHFKINCWTWHFNSRFWWWNKVHSKCFPYISLICIHMDQRPMHWNYTSYCGVRLLLELHTNAYLSTVKCQHAHWAHLSNSSIPFNYTIVHHQV